MAISRGIRHGSPRVGDVLNNIPVITNSKTSISSIHRRFIAGK